MPALKQTEFYAIVKWLGKVADSDETLASQEVDEMDVTFEGAAGECHSGLTRPACSRVRAQHPRGTTIANARQFSILSVEELLEIAEACGIDEFDPAWVGASIVIEGIGDFSHVPPSSRLQNDAGTTLVIDMENRPCMLPGRVIEAVEPGKGKAFLAAARGKRGVTAWVEREGPLKVGDVLRLHIPDQPAWAHLDKARSPQKP